MGLEAIVEKDPYAGARDVGELIDIAIKENGYKSRSAYLREKGEEKGFNADSANRWFADRRIPLEKLLFFAEDLSVPSSEFERFGYDIENPYSNASNITELLDTAIQLNNYSSRREYLLEKSNLFNYFAAKSWIVKGRMPMDKLLFFANDLSIPKSEFKRFGLDLKNPYKNAEHVFELIDISIHLNGYNTRESYFEDRAKHKGLNLGMVTHWTKKGEIPLEKLLFLADDLSIPASELERFGYDIHNAYSHASNVFELVDLSIRLNGYRSRKEYLSEESKKDLFGCSTVSRWFQKGDIPIEKLMFLVKDLSIPIGELQRFGYNVDSLYSHASSLAELIDSAIFLKGYKFRKEYLIDKGFNPSTYLQWIKKNNFPLDKLEYLADDLSIPKSEFERFGYDLENPYLQATGISGLLELGINFKGYNNRKAYLKKKAEEGKFSYFTAIKWFTKGNFPISKLTFFAEDLGIPESEFERFGINISNPYADAETMSQALRTAISLKGETIAGYLRSREGERPFPVYMGQAFFSKNSFSDEGLEFLINDLDLPDTVFGDSEWSVYESIMHYKDSLGDESWDVKTYFETFEGKPLYQYVIQFYKSEPVKNQVGFEDFLYSQVPEEHKEEAWYVLSGQYKEDLMMNKLSELAEDNELLDGIRNFLGD